MLSLSQKLRSDNAEFLSKCAATEKDIRAYADTNDFINLRPKVGIAGETQYTLTFSGLTAAFPSKYVELGGYCSKMPATNFSLRANQKNYIYLVRDSIDRHKLHIDNRAELYGDANNDAAFSRVLVAILTTNTVGVVNAQYFTI